MIFMLKGHQLFLSVFVAWLFSFAALAEESKPLSYYKEVFPIFKRSCTGCHHPGKLKGELDLTTYAAFQKGGKLETLAHKIKKAKDLGLLDEASFKDADLLREIRNEFGHLKTKVHFDSPEIEKWAQHLSTYEAAEPNQAAICAGMTKVTDCLNASMKRI